MSYPSMSITGNVITFTDIDGDKVNLVFGTVSAAHTIASAILNTNELYQLQSVTCVDADEE